MNNSITIKNKPSLETVVRNTHKNTREQARDYFNSRGINNESIDKFLLGILEQRYMIPVFNKDGEVVYVKFRINPADESSEFVAKAMGSKKPMPKYEIYPASAKPILVGEDQLAKSTSVDVLICNGELDRIITIQNGAKMPVVTGGCSAQEFKNEWIDALKNMRNIYICLKSDSDVEELANRISDRIPSASVYKVSLPFDEKGKDLTDYFVEKRGTTEDLFTKYSAFCCGAKPIDPTKFKELTVEDIANVLDSTIKYDFEAKCIIFLAMILTYTESDQLNIMINGDSSSGKSYNVSEVSKLFPEQDVLFYGKTTPNAFYYSVKLRKTDEDGQMYMDLERRIMIFIEQPDTKLQANLRSLLSHDKKRIPFAITNKGKKGENTACEGYMLGFPSTFFCSANMLINEQEQTRCLIISPETTKEKVLAGINTCLDKSRNKKAYDKRIENDEIRNQLIERILYIKGLNIDTINVGDIDYLKNKFMKNRKGIQPKAQREISHFISLVKGMALINAPFRMVDGQLTTTRKDVDEAMKLWEPLSKNISFGVSAQTFDFYKNIILTAYFKKNENNAGPAKSVTYRDIAKEYFSQYGSYPNMENIRKQYVPALEIASLISYSKGSDNDKRMSSIMPLVFFNDDMEEQV